MRRSDTIYDALYVVQFCCLFDRRLGPIAEEEFANWHAEAVYTLRDFERPLSVGWAAKMIAIYLKTTCYLAGYGRDGLERVIHPPLDNTLMGNLRREFGYYPEIAVGVNRFRGIGVMDSDNYHAIIASCRLIADEMGCSLFEVEQPWR